MPIEKTRIRAARDIGLISLTSFDFGSNLILSFRSINLNAHNTLILSVPLEGMRMSLTVNRDARPFVLRNVDEGFMNVSVGFDKVGT